jgi:hypothetical protein
VGFPDLVAVADRAVQAHLGGTVRYEPRFGGPVDVPGVFVEAYHRGDPGQGAGVVTTAPAVFLRLSDLPSDPETDEPIITANGTRYRVREPVKDEMGGVLLHLKEA